MTHQILIQFDNLLLTYISAQHFCSIRIIKIIKSTISSSKNVQEEKNTVKNYTKEYEQAILYVFEKRYETCKFVRYSVVHIHLYTACKKFCYTQMLNIVRVTVRF